MPNISQNLDKCLFSKRDVSLFIDNEKAGDASQKSEIIHELAPKHKATVVEFSSSQSVEFDQILKKLYLEAEKLIGYSVEKSLTRFSNEKKVFVLIELLKDCVLVFHDIKSIDQKTMVELQRMSLTLKRYTRARLRIIFVCLEDVDVLMLGYAWSTSNFISPIFLKVSSKNCSMLLMSR